MTNKEQHIESAEVEEEKPLGFSTCKVKVEDPNNPMPVPKEEPIDNKIKVRKQDLEDFKIKEVLKQWKAQQEADRELRKKYGKCLLWFLAVQLVLFNIIFIIGFMKELIDNEHMLYWLGTLAVSIASTVGAIAKGLFKNTTKDLYKLVSTMFKEK